MRDDSHLARMAQHFVDLSDRYATRQRNRIASRLGWVLLGAAIGFLSAAAVAAISAAARGGMGAM